jgi:hypothetical protein
MKTRRNIDGGKPTMVIKRAQRAIAESRKLLEHIAFAEKN